MVVVNTKQEKRSPNWQDHLGALTRLATDNEPRSGPFKPGTKTLGYKQMESSERMHGQSLAQQYKMHSESLALDEWIAQQNLSLQWAQFNAAQEALKEATVAQNAQSDFMDQINQIYAPTDKSGRINFGALAGHTNNKPLEGGDTSHVKQPYPGYYHDVAEEAKYKPGGPTNETTMTRIQGAPGTQLHNDPMLDELVNQISQMDQGKVRVPSSEEKWRMR